MSLTESIIEAIRNKWDLIVWGDSPSDFSYADYDDLKQTIKKAIEDYNGSHV